MCENCQRKLHTKAGEVKLRIPKLRTQTFETAIIERYRQRENLNKRIYGTIEAWRNRPDRGRAP